MPPLLHALVATVHVMYYFVMSDWLFCSLVALLEVLLFESSVQPCQQCSITLRPL
jgi:hypothetical protein